MGSIQTKKQAIGVRQDFDPIEIPKLFIDSNVLHLPTLKTHGHTKMTGAMKNAFGGLLKEARHHCHKYIHDVLIDLLIIQKEIHSGLFAVMDGTVYGDGAGPRTMIPKIANLLLASGDMVSLDSTASRIMGFEPSQINKLKKSDDMGLGNSNIQNISVIGESPEKINLKLKKVP